MLRHFILFFFLDQKRTIKTDFKKNASQKVLFLKKI